MKLNAIIIILSLSLLYACTEKKSLISPTGKTPELAFSENLGCSSNSGVKNLNEYYYDTMFYYVQNDSLKVVLNLFNNCNHYMQDSLIFKIDTIDIYVDIFSFGGAGCVCDFEFDYAFIEYGDNIKFNVYTRYPYFEEEEYTLRMEMNYP